TEGHASSECFVLTPTKEISIDGKSIKLDRRYLAHALRSDVVLGQIIYQVSGVGRPRINIGTLLNTKIPLPLYDKQQKIVKELEVLHDKRRALEETIKENQNGIQEIILNSNTKMGDSLLA
ncbi:MAG: restriction endonuclease subunit S, partial [Patescibacteria group bacterium]|nr:restriction endonuclease subunit S [Patescibacteria group bacterium]